MPDKSQICRPIRVASVIASIKAGGIGVVCRYAAEGMAKLKGWQVTLLSLHDPCGDFVDAASGLRVVCLGLDTNCARQFLQWITANPQDLLITSGVCQIESAFRFLPPNTRHVMQIHDSGRHYRATAVRHAAWIDGVICVGRHYEALLRRSLDEVDFHGLLRTVHNGAKFPPLTDRIPQSEPLRLLFLGQVEALKGVFDFVPLLQRLRKLRVPVTLNIVGGENAALRQQFERKGLTELVAWAGRVPHEQCYAIAAVSDLLLLPTRKESFGMVTIEAMSMGCVPIAYNIPSGSAEIIEDGKNGLLVPLGDIPTWANCIQRLHQDRKWLAELAAGAITRARGTFNAETMSCNLANFLTEVLEHSKTHPAARDIGMPPEMPPLCAQLPRGYQRLPAGLREWIRNRVCSSPRLSHWLLSR